VSRLGCSARWAPDGAFQSTSAFEDLQARLSAASVTKQQISTHVQLLNVRASRVRVSCERSVLQGTRPTLARWGVSVALALHESTCCLWHSHCMSRLVVWASPLHMHAPLLAASADKQTNTSRGKGNPGHILSAYLGQPAKLPCLGLFSHTPPFCPPVKGFRHDPLTPLVSFVQSVCHHNDTPARCF